MHKLAAICFGLLAFGVCCSAQKESLLIGPGDLIHVQVFDTPEMEQKVRVNDAGNASLPFIGDTAVVGKTPAEAARFIEQTLVSKQYMLHPQVTVTVDQYATQGVSVMGQVTNPGAYPISTPRSLIDILSLAGGLTDTADRHITVQRRGDPEHKATYYLSNESNEAFKNDILVNPGDTVLVPKVPVVYVLGDVARPGGFPMNTNDSQITVLQAVAMAGSANKSAIRSKIRLIRKSGQGEQEIPVALASIEKGKQPDFPLQPNDILFIPFSYMKNIAVNGSGIAAAATQAVIYK